MHTIHKVCVFGNGDDDEKYVSSSGCVLSSIDDADFVLTRGTFAVLFGPEDKDRITFAKSEEFMASNILHESLQKCADLQLPMLVTNPDFHRPGSGSPMPGMISDLYSKLILGQEYDLITSIGKPFREVYNKCFEFLEEEREEGKIIDEKRICCIGDSFDHDIVGAVSNKLDCVFIANGVHCDALGTSEGSPVLPTTEKLSAFQDQYNTLATPTYTMASFKL